MTEHPALIHVPVGTGATRREALRRFHAEVFIPNMPPDFEPQLLSRTIGQNRVIDEFILRFTHTVRMDWFFAWIEPTGRRLEVPTVAIIAFEGGKIASEHIHWDHASALVQLGLLDGENPAALGRESCARPLDPEAEANRLIDWP